MARGGGRGFLWAATAHFQPSFVRRTASDTYHWSIGASFNGACPLPSAHALLRPTCLCFSPTPPPAFLFWQVRETLRAHLDVMGELITRDKNHASVVMWSVANEPDSEAAAGTSKKPVDQSRTVATRVCCWAEPPCALSLSLVCSQRRPTSSTLYSRPRPSTLPAQSPSPHSNRPIRTSPPRM